ncbi:MAG: SMP-30/gluconolactonase/LRE family protein [Phycisphaerae bacterium]|nr:SMP-30/gluconolactonase/LRE family protein [Phycisphaerae bacterium]
MLTPFLAIALLQASPRPPALPATPPDAAAKPVERGPIPGLVAADSKPVQIATGFRFTEGPASDATGQFYFVDVPTARVMRLVSHELDASRAHDNATEFVVNNGGCFGLMFDHRGRLFGTQGGPPGLSASGAPAKVKRGGLVEIDLATKEIRHLDATVEIDGESLPVQRSNDLAVDRAGGAYVTDPSLGRTKSKTKGVLYRAEDGTATRVDSTIEAPNGVRLSPDGKRLYVLSYADPGVYRFEVLSPGKLGPAEKFASLVGADGIAPRGRGDGLALDMHGNLWCTNPDAAEIQVISPEGTMLGRVGFPEAPSNCAFGGPDGKTLFVTAVTSVYALRTEVIGFWLARTANDAPAIQTPTAVPEGQ